MRSGASAIWSDTDAAVGSGRTSSARLGRRFRGGEAPVPILRGTDPRVCGQDDRLLSRISPFSARSHLASSGSQTWHDSCDVLHRPWTELAVIFKKTAPPRGPSRAGQSTVEYMLVISVLVLAMYAAAQALVPEWKSGLETMSGNVQQMASDGYVGGS